MGKIWVSNERQRRDNNTFKRKGLKKINKYKRELTSLGRVVDETMMQIRKNVQQDRIERDRVMMAFDIDGDGDYSKDKRSMYNKKLNGSELRRPTID